MKRSESLLTILNACKTDEGVPSPLPTLPEHVQDQFIDQTRRLRALDEQIFILRTRVAEQPPGPTAFALLASPVFARTIPPTLPTFFDSVKHLFKPRFRILAAPSPRDVAWARLGKQHSWPSYVLRTIGVWTLITALTVFWTIPVGFVVSLLSLDNLVELFPWIAPAVDSMGPAVKGLIQGLVPALVVSIWQAILPLVLTGESIPAIDCGQTLLIRSPFFLSNPPAPSRSTPRNSFLSPALSSPCIPHLFAFQPSPRDPCFIGSLFYAYASDHRPRLDPYLA